MPTGYTRGVADGEVTDFRSFAMECARAFGALVEMRDDPMGAPIPFVFEPNPYSIKAAADAKAELARLRGLTPDEAEAAAGNEFARCLEAWLAGVEEKSEKRRRYSEMLAKVNAWIPPTADHVEMKRFMASQLKDSIKQDCGPMWDKPEAISGAEWLTQKIAAALGNIEYHGKQAAEDALRAQERTAWVRALRGSL